MGENQKLLYTKSYVVWWCACLGLHTAELLAVRIYSSSCGKCVIRKSTVGKELDMTCLLTEKFQSTEETALVFPLSNIFM